MERVIKPSNADTSYHPRWLTLVRIFLGIVLIHRGIVFFMDQTQLTSLLGDSSVFFISNNRELWAWIITYCNLLGGVFIATGLGTRWVSLLLIPMLIGAVILNINAGLAEGAGNLILSIISLVLLVLFVKLGSGNISADEFFRSYTHAGRVDGFTRKFFQ
jgi:putative oxidoreductase